MAELKCQMCGYEWNYTGNQQAYCTCPACFTSVSVDRTTASVAEAAEAVEEDEEDDDLGDEAEQDADQIDADLPDRVESEG